MHAFQLAAFDGTGQIVDLPQPKPGPGEVLIKIAACGLNFADLLMLKGQYQERPALPFTLGMEVSGTIVAHGDGVVTPAIGTRVAVFAGTGGLADYGTFAASRCLPLPDDMPFDHAAAFMIAYGTSHLALGHRARLQKGETLLVTGAAGGVGLTAVEIGAAMGARVIALARGPEKLEAARAAGAHVLLDSDTTPDLRGALRDLGGVDVVYDTIGGDTFMAALRATRPEGRLIPIGFAGGEVPQIPANLLLVKNLTVIGLYWGGYGTFAPDLLTSSLSELLGLYSKGQLKPHVSHSLPLSRVSEALELLRSRKSTGKVVVTMG